MRALVVDAYDSFVYILYQYLLNLGVEQRVVRNDEVTFDEVDRYGPDFILLGPGPGHPKDAGYVELVQRYGGRVPILGVCLGHQAIGLAFGGRVARAEHLMHGKTSLIAHDAQGCFRDVKQPLTATRYHSLIVEDDGLPAVLQVTARSEDDNYIMGLRHTSLAIESLQFHPESAYTEQGLNLLDNFIAAHVRSAGSSKEIRS